MFNPLSKAIRGGAYAATGNPDALKKGGTTVRNNASQSMPARRPKTVGDLSVFKGCALTHADGSPKKVFTELIPDCWIGGK